MYSSKPLSERGKTAIPLILHLDMDAFFASVEIRSYPRLEGLPVVVGGGPGPRGVVTAASYPARRFGIHAGMALAQARRRCSRLMILPVNASKVVHESLAILKLLETFSACVDPASIDEATVHFDPVPGRQWVSLAQSLATRMQQQVLRERNLGCSIGVGCNRLQAKMASARHKPRGITLVPPGSFSSLFQGSPVGEVPGIGERTQSHLHRLGIYTLEDLASASQSRLSSCFGARYASVLGAVARGVDDRPVAFQYGESDPNSAGHEMTFSRDMNDSAYLEAAVCLLAHRVARRLRRAALYASAIGVSYTVGKQKHAKQRKLNIPTQSAQDMAAVAWPLLREASRGERLRLVGVRGMRLSRTGPPPVLFPEDRRRLLLTETEDFLRDRFGEHVLMPARTYWSGSSRGDRHRLRGWHPPENHE